MCNNPWDVKIDLTEFWKQVKRLSRNENTPVLMFCNTRYGLDLLNSNPTWFRYELIWSKDSVTGFMNANWKPLQSHEMIYVFCKKKPYYRRINYIEGNRCPSTVISIGRKQKKGQHPTQKPDELWEWLIQRYCPENGTILDPTAGSFHSVFTATKLGRKGIGIEMNDKYFWKAVAEMNKNRV